MCKRNFYEKLQGEISRFVVILLLVALTTSVRAQLTKSGSIPSDKVGVRAKIGTMSTDAAIMSADISATAEISCSAYPQVSFYAARDGQKVDLADMGSIDQGSKWSAPLNIVGLTRGDTVYAEITQEGIGCVNDSPLSVTLVFTPVADSCLQDPPECFKNARGLDSSIATSSSTLLMTVQSNPATYESRSSSLPFSFADQRSSTDAGVAYADQFDGHDAGDMLNAAIAAACSQGVSVVDATGLTGDQYSASTISLPCGIHLILPGGVWTLNGDPGIAILSYEPSIVEGQGWEYNYDPASPSRGTVLKSGSPALLIADTRSQGSQWKNLELDGAGVGLVGYFGAGGVGAPTFEDIHSHDFIDSGIISIAFASYFTGRIMSSNNGGDGIVTAIETKMEGEQQTWQNGGSAYHFFGGGGRIVNAVAGTSGQHGIYVDARMPEDWTQRKLYEVTTVIHPGQMNPGGYYFYSLHPASVSGSRHPNFCQFVGCIVVDGTARWINIGSVVGPYLGAIEHFNLIGADSELNGTRTNPMFVFDNIRYEGSSIGNRTCALSSITNVFVNQVSAANPNAQGLHLLNCYGMEISQYTYAGPASYTGPVTQDYALVLENTNDTSVDQLFSQRGGGSMIKEINTLNVRVSSATSYGTGQLGLSPPDNYAVQIDGASTNATFIGLTVDQFPGCLNQRGVYNRGSNTLLIDYSRQSSVVDDLGSATLLMQQQY